MKRIKTGLCIVASAVAASCGSDDLVTRAVVETSAIAERSTEGAAAYLDCERGP